MRLLLLLLQNVQRRGGVQLRAQFKRPRLQELGAQTVESQCGPVKVPFTSKVVLRPQGIVVQEGGLLQGGVEQALVQLLIVVKVLVMFLMLMMVQKLVTTLAGRAPWATVA